MTSFGMEVNGTDVQNCVCEFASGIKSKEEPQKWFFFTFGAGGFRSNELERVQDSIPWVKEVFQNPVRL